MSANITNQTDIAGPVISFHYGAQGHGKLKNLLKKSLVIICISSAVMFVLSEALAYPFSFLFLRDGRQLVLSAVHAFRIISFTDALKSTVNKKSSELKKPATASKPATSKKATNKKASSK